MGLRITQVDAFTAAPFGGNPAGVCILPVAKPAEWMQAVAREMNLSETAFLLREDGGFNLRWFTPQVEVDLCGHATLASAHVLWETGALAPDEQARFSTRSGILTATRWDDWIEMDFPLRPEQPTAAPEGLAEALGATPLYVGQNVEDYLVEVRSETVLRALKPDFGALGTLPVRGLIVTARSETADFDFVSRFFAPAVGIDEDPVTGSAHCCLAAFWAGRLGKDELLGHQVSERGGIVRVRVAGDRVLISGQAVTVLRGELLVD
jgi:PhzF family phenazine biosynthesis protein